MEQGVALSVSKTSTDRGTDPTKAFSILRMRRMYQVRSSNEVPGATTPARNGAGRSRGPLAKIGHQDQVHYEADGGGDDATRRPDGAPPFFVDMVQGERPTTAIPTAAFAW
jgi:hypothetical protein